MAKKESKKILTLIAAIALPVAKNMSEKTINNILEKSNEKKKEEKLYNNEKHSQLIKASLIIMLMMSSLFTVIAIKRTEIISVIIGIFSIISLGYAYLLCLEIFKEKRKNTYKVVLAVGLMLLVVVIANLYL